MREDPFWADDVGVLARRPAEFFPSKDMSAAERFNSLVRLVAYSTLAVWAYRRDANSLAFGLVLVALLTSLYNPVTPSARANSTEQGPRPCVWSTPENPFANPLAMDDPARPAACPYDAMKDDVRANFNRGLPRDADDLYERENSQYQYYTLPSSAPVSDTRAFAEFLYGERLGRRTCKEDPAECMYRK